MTRHTVIAPVVLALGLLGGCHSLRGTARPERQMPTAAFDHLQLGRTTAAEVEQAFGAPDERGADGAMIYHGAVRTGLAVRPETVIFRFDHGILVKLCQNRAR